MANTNLPAKLRGMRLPRGYNAEVLTDAAAEIEQQTSELEALTRELEAARSEAEGYRGSLYASLHEVVVERDRLRALLRDVATSGVEIADPRIRYVTVQVDRETWEAIQALKEETHDH